MEKTKRNRAATTDRILNALEELLAQQGLAGVNMTRLAQKAAVSKILIYRYFGNLEGLIRHYVQSGRVLPPNTPALVKPPRATRQKDVAAYWSATTLHSFAQLRLSAAARQLLKASVQAHDPLGDTVSEGLDQELSTLVEAFSLVKGGDYAALSAVLLGGLSYLTIQAELDRSVLGMDLRGEADWQRVEQAVGLIYRGLARLAADANILHVSWKPTVSRCNPRH
ncbi:TetR/AcrR family transcriptional regulator [Spirosoma pulveris]